MSWRIIARIALFLALVAAITMVMLVLLGKVAACSPHEPYPLQPTGQHQ